MLEIRHSVFRARALGEVAAREWNLDPPVGCTLWRRHMADVYMLRARGRPFVLKVYHAGWRHKHELSAELRFARYLVDAGVSVAEPFSGKVIDLKAPEGTRHAVLYHHTPGKSLCGQPTEENARRLGRLLAQVHWAAADYADANRPHWDVDALLHEPVYHLAPFLSETDVVFLTDAVKELAKRFEGLPESFWHGDVHPDNVHFDNHGNPTLFDFDFCGVGPLAYDLATLLYEARWAGWGPEIGRRFLEGYGEADPFFVDRLAPARGIWFLGLLARNVDDWGHHELHHYLLDRHVELIRKLIDETAA